MKDYTGIDYRDSKLYKGMTPYLACAYVEGFEEGEISSETEILTAFQYLVDTGQCWSLQGWYGRTAQGLIDAGVIQPAKETARVRA